ncbi:MAG: hypothetical protein EZS28_032297 [Streblomastix strix]|uniref:DNA-directed DNA polymerase n=1 Tax=Streblomastix strix TaxID=222440 RepID=A0A5J4UNA0_9EUKA|nr:MAG: hypothetical protein EZS28_032297 [Streblomastix strix]
MKYDDENIPFDRCVKVLVWNNSRFYIALLWDALDCELWTMGVLIGDLNNTKSITVIHKKSHMKLQFIDAENLFGPMTLKVCVKDYGDKSEHKDVFFYEVIHSKNWKEVLVKTEPFEYDDFNSQLKGASCAHATKHYSTHFPSQFNLESDKPVGSGINAKQAYYEDFDINADYSNPNSQTKPFVLSAGYWKNKCYHYKQQDYKAGRETEKNVTADNYDYYKKLFETSVCSICSAKFTFDNPSCLDRQDNELPHTKDNCLPACVSYNIAHANRNPNIASLRIKMKYYAIKYNLPMTISDERIYNLLRECITGGLAAVFYRENIAGKTQINELTYNEQSNKVISQDNENVTTRVFALDGNSLYPSLYSSVKNENIPYTDNRMYMAGRSKFNSEKPYIIKNCIDQRKEIFVAKVKGYFPKFEYNNLLPLPPIFRNIEIENMGEVIGEYMYSQEQKLSLPMTKKDRKLTTLFDTNGQFMVFNNYYLWLLIDLGFVITDYKSVAVFEKNAACEPFVRTMMNLRIQAILAGSSKEKFYKLKINTSYGYDTLNTQRFGKIKMLDKADTFIAQHHPNHIDTRRISANTFAVQIKSKTATYRKRFHFVLADTDSIYIAITGDPAKDYIYDHKKILGFGIENEGYELTSLGPMCYSMIVLKWSNERQQYEFKPKITSKGLKAKDYAIKDQ